MVWLALYMLKLVHYIDNKFSLDLLQHRENIFLLLQVALVTQLIAWRCGQPIQVNQNPLQKAINKNNFQNIFSVGGSMQGSSHPLYRVGGCKQQSMRCTLHQGVRTLKHTNPQSYQTWHSLVRIKLSWLGCQYSLNCIGLVGPPETTKRCWPPDCPIQPSLHGRYFRLEV